MAGRVSEEKLGTACAVNKDPQSSIPETKTYRIIATNINALNLVHLLAYITHLSMIHPHPPHQPAHRAHPTIPYLRHHLHPTPLRLRKLV